MNQSPLSPLAKAPISPKSERAAKRQRARLAEMVSHARARSPYYGELYQRLPERVEDPALLPVVQKKELMARFDDWLADRNVTLDEARSFVASPERIGKKLLGKYVISTTAGTTGTPGIFVLDDRHVSAGMTAVGRAFRQYLSTGDWLRIMARAGRTAAVHATGGHYASVGAITRMQRSSRFAARLLRQFSVHTPLTQLVAQLNDFNPALLTGYATVTSLLAGEQEAGRLRINPVLVVVTAEGLPEDEYGRMSKAFDANVGNIWGSTEMSGLAYSCAHGWLHIIDDWLIIEPVDADHRPTQRGEQSHTVLISNLANRVQPILRYDLGDRILVRPDPCPCGNPLPAIKVTGRSSDALSFAMPNGHRVTIPPLALELDEIPGIELCQIVQTSPTSLRVRFLTAAGSDREQLWRAAYQAIERRLIEQKLGHVTIERADEPPEQSGGEKFRQVIPLSSDPLSNLDD